MTRLWIIADSFAVKDQPAQISWWELLSERLSVSLCRMAVSGCSTHWQVRQWLSIRRLIEPRDWVILVNTHPQRLWLYAELPELTIADWAGQWIARFRAPRRIQQIDRRDLPPIDPRWVEQHFRDPHWQSMTEDLQQLLVNNITLTVPERSLIIPAFQGCEPKIDSVKGCLWDISQGEFRSDDWQEIAKCVQQGDHRAGHLSEQNHRILSDRIFDRLTNHSSELDLTEGYATGLIDPRDWPYKRTWQQ